MSHTLPAYLGLSDLDAALVADYAFVAYSLVLSAKAFEVLGGTEYAFAEKSVSLRFQRPVIDCLRFGHLTIRPASYLLG